MALIFSDAKETFENKWSSFDLVDIRPKGDKLSNSLSTVIENLETPQFHIGQLLRTKSLFFSFRCCAA